MIKRFLQILAYYSTQMLGGLLLLMSVAAVLSLCTYYPTDPSFNAALEGDVRNLMGQYGALAADLLWQWLGFASVLVALLIGRWGWLCWRHQWSRHVGLRLSFAVPGLLFASMAFSFGGYKGAPACEYGGILGAVLAGQLLDWCQGLHFAFQLWWGLPLLAVLTMVALAYAGCITRTHLSTWATTTATVLADIWSNRNHLQALWAYWMERRTPEEKGESLHDYQRPDSLPTHLQPLTNVRVSLVNHPINGPENDEAEEDYEDEAMANSNVLRLAPIEPTPEARLFKKPAAKAKPVPQKPLDLMKNTGRYQLPALGLLQIPKQVPNLPMVDEVIHRERAKELEAVLNDFGVRGEIVQINPGPVVTLYELRPSAGTKSSRVISLADDIARSMSAISARVAVVPGRNVIGIEIPNPQRLTVYLRELLATPTYERNTGSIPLALGKDIGGAPVIADLARMPHLLVAGTTGSGKSVAINTMILSLLYRLPPEKCKFIMIDPKMLELSVYDGIPHLLSPVVTDPKKAVVALKWVVREMENRYRDMSKLGVRNIAGYNSRIQQARETGEIITRKIQTGFDPESGKPVFENQALELTPLPFMVVVVDEMADLMLVAGKEIESAVQRLAQMARAAGIHLIMATQRPSVDVITGTIKANFPTRISFQVTSKIDSRTILGEQGAEQLLGQGDMLYMAPGGRLMRVHGPYVSDQEVEEIVAFLKQQGEPTYIEAITEDPDADEDTDEEASGNEDPMYEQAVELVRREGKASTSFIQRHLQIGYNRAARMVELMEKRGIVSAANHVGKREVIGG